MDGSGRVWARGSGSSGQLGVGAGRALKAASEEWALVPLAGRFVVAVAAGQRHSVAVSSAGDVYAWGRGFEGQTGLARPPPRSETGVFQSEAPPFDGPETLADSASVASTSKTTDHFEAVAVGDPTTNTQLVPKLIATLNTGGTARKRLESPRPSRHDTHTQRERERERG